MPVSYQEFPNRRLVELRVAGRVTQRDFDAIVEPLRAFIDAHRPIRLIENVDSLDGFDPAMIWPGIRFDLKNLKHVSHVAVVSDIGWLSQLAKAAGAVLSTKLRTFALDEIGAARAWIEDSDPGAG